LGCEAFFRTSLVLAVRYDRSTMRVFEVFLNGERLCCAGIENAAVLDVIVNHVKHNEERDEWIDVGGLTNAGEFVKWANRPLGAGDEIRIKVLESNSADEPRERKRRNVGQELEDQKRYVREMAKQLGWTLNE
jgi:hypothetical protein